MQRTSTAPVPWQPRLAVFLTACIAVLGLLQSFRLPSDPTPMYLWVVHEILIPSVLAWGLWLRTRWAWWASVLFLGLLSLGSLFAVFFFVPDSSKEGWALELMNRPEGLMSIAFAAVTVGLLINPASRVVFRGAA